MRVLTLSRLFLPIVAATAMVGVAMATPSSATEVPGQPAAHAGVATTKAPPPKHKPKPKPSKTTAKPKPSKTTASPTPAKTTPPPTPAKTTPPPSPTRTTASPQPTRTLLPVTGSSGGGSLPVVVALGLALVFSGLAVALYSRIRRRAS